MIHKGKKTLVRLWANLEVLFRLVKEEKKAALSEDKNPKWEKQVWCPGDTWRGKFNYEDDVESMSIGTQFIKNCLESLVEEFRLIKISH